MPDWTSLISNAARGLSSERGANARSADEILGDAIRDLSSDAELAAFYEAARGIVDDRPTSPKAELRSAEVRLLADAIITLETRELQGERSAVQKNLLEEVCWGLFNGAWKAHGATPRVPFAPDDATALYVRAILRELGSPLKATETAGGSSLFGADPMTMLDLIERDGNVSRFLSVLLAYSNQGWLHPADIILRFNRWHTALLSVSSTDIAYRTALTVVGHAEDFPVLREKLVLLLLNVVALLLERTESLVGVVAGVYNARPSADTLLQLTAEQFGVNAMSRALADRHREASTLGRAQESSVVRYIEHLSQDAQELSDQWRSTGESQEEITGLVCEVLHTRARTKPIDIQGATQAQLIDFYY
ncbi:hypothetical protein [Brevundimonas sp.]|uniref:hypothetical protein n=1 Tax=Brevundimonas sp. TaxID=1871086 RepID=UPI00272FAC21|nr:hypothetical protein [Brevundimonas sp.]MDP1912113.1 hypothetical protein [Brevundimonas sp.]